MGIRVRVRGRVGARVRVGVRVRVRTSTHAVAVLLRAEERLSKARLKRVSSRPAWMHWSAVACRWVGCGRARSLLVRGSSPVWHTINSPLFGAVQGEAQTCE